MQTPLFPVFHFPNYNFKSASAENPFGGLSSDSKFRKAAKILGYAAKRESS
jgi:hypothetical protein